MDRAPSTRRLKKQSDEEEIGYSYNEREQSIRKLRNPETRLTTNAIDMTSFSGLFEFAQKKNPKNQHKQIAEPGIKLKNCDRIRQLIKQKLSGLF